MSTDRHRRHRLVGVLVLVSLVLITADFRLGAQGPLHTAQQLAMAAFTPLQDGLGAAVRPVGGLLTSVGRLGGLRREHEALRAELAALQAGSADVSDLARENAELRAALGMRDRLELTTTAARVIGQPPGTLRWSVHIDVGADDGVAPAMAVINADGLVGRVSDVTASHARVQLAVSPAAGYAVRIADSGEQGLLEGRGSQPMELLLLDTGEAAAEVGSQVVTRVFEGATVPDGLPLGVVAGTRGELVDVDPHVDFSSLDIVLVVRDVPALPTGFEAEAADGG